MTVTETSSPYNESPYNISGNTTGFTLKEFSGIKSFSNILDLYGRAVKLIDTYKNYIWSAIETIFTMGLVLSLGSLAYNITAGSKLGVSINMISILNSSLGIFLYRKVSTYKQNEKNFFGQMKQNQEDILNKYLEIVKSMPKFKDLETSLGTNFEELDLSKIKELITKYVQDGGKADSLITEKLEKIRCGIEQVEGFDMSVVSKGLDGIIDSIKDFSGQASDLKNETERLESLQSSFSDLFESSFGSQKFTDLKGVLESLSGEIKKVQGISGFENLGPMVSYLKVFEGFLEGFKSFYLNLEREHNKTLVELSKIRGEIKSNEDKCRSILQTALNIYNMHSEK